MLPDLLSSLFAVPVLAQAAGDLTWTPMTFYIAAGIAQCVAILLSFRVLQLDPEHNTFVGAVMAAGITNVAAFMMKDAGLFGVIGTTALLFILLVAISHADMIRAVITWVVLVALWGGLAFVIVPRTDTLYIEDVAGVPQVILQGGLEAEPITEQDSRDLVSGDKKKR